MSDDHLSDDLRAWPSNPFDLLGVPHDADPRTVKRAYTRLLRRFKPEQAPEHFQRLRAAYEVAEQQAIWRQQHRDQEDEEPAEEEAEVAVVAGEVSERADEITSADLAPWQVKRSAPRDCTETAWSAACEGDLAQAYRQLVAWHHGPTKTELVHGYAQLYWLLTLDPNLDAEQTSLDWLVTGLARTRCDWRLLQLLERELLRDPELAFAPRIDQLLETLDGAGLLEVLPLRWRAARSLDNPSLIAEEIERYGGRIVYDHAAAWDQLVLLTLEQNSLGVYDEELWRPYLAELGTATSEEHLGARLDRLDLLLQLASRWSELERSNHPQLWLRLLRECYWRTSEQLDPLLAEIVAQMAQSPLRYLLALDQLLESFGFAAFELFQHLEGFYWRRGVRLNDQLQCDGDIRLPGKLIGAIRMFRNYPWTRNELVQWSLGAGVPLIQAAGVIRFETDVDLSDAIQADVSYRYIFAAWRVFWGDGEAVA